MMNKKKQEKNEERTMIHTETQLHTYRNNTNKEKWIRSV